MNIAIQGHPIRGKEIIQILESLGGKNKDKLYGDGTIMYYFINKDNNISWFVKGSSNDYKCYTIEEFETKFPFKIGDKVITNDCSIGIIIHLIPEHISSYCVKLNNVYSWCTPSSLRLYKEMNTRNITLTLEKAKEWYKQGGDLKEVALQAFTEQELNLFPKSWEEYCKTYIVPTNIFGPHTPLKYIALWKLEQLRNCYRQGWKSNWVNNYSIKYCIIRCSDTLTVGPRSAINTFLSFQSRKVAEEFLKNFEPLIKEAGDLI